MRSRVARPRKVNREWTRMDANRTGFELSPFASLRGFPDLPRDGRSTRVCGKRYGWKTLGDTARDGTFANWNRTFNTQEFEDPLKNNHIILGLSLLTSTRCGVSSANLHE